MKKRLIFLLRCYLMTVLVFVGAKVVFMLCNRGVASFTAGDVLAVLAHGLSLDLSTALYFLIVPFLAVVVSLWWNGKLLARLLDIYFVVVAVAFAVAFVADTSLYPFWRFKLDASCLQYLESPTEAMASVTGSYLVLRAVAIVVVAALLFFIRPRGLGKLPPVRGRLKATLLWLLLIPFLVIGIRGGIGMSTTNIGQVYYSQNQFLNHAAVNPVFSFLYSLSHQLDDLSQYHFFSTEECGRLTDGIYHTESVETDTLLRTDRPNILIIMLESAGEQFAAVMPKLQQLKREGISFSRCYANSWRTDRGTVSTLSGYPSFPTVSVMKIPEKSRTLPSIAQTLKGQGYKTSYLYGGDINFTNMRSYLISTGWNQLTSMSDYPRDAQLTARWGVRDDITFQTLLDQLAAAADGGHHLWGYSTLSSHEPWDVPAQVLDDEVLNAFAYLDNCLADFVEKVRKMPLWDNLLIVLVADHGIIYGQTDRSTPQQMNHIPMVWLGGAVKAPRDVNVICNQSDLAATLLGQLHLPHADFTFSRDVLSQTYTYPTAVNNYPNVQWLCDSTGYVLYDFDMQRLLASHGPDAVRLQQVNKAILQKTTNDLLNR